MNKRRFVGFERRTFARIHREFILDIEETDLRKELGITKKEEERLIGKTLNVSASGLLFEVEKNVPLGTTINLTIKIPGWQKYMMATCKTKRIMRSPSFKAIAKVVRNEEITSGELYDIGVVFINISSEHKVAMKKYINDNA
ncbi:PilZ domain-containing protein [Candidatus Omnitrophota bacterium]